MEKNLIKVPFPDYIANETELGGGSGPLEQNGIHINARAAGLVGLEHSFFIDRTPTCSIPPENVPWKTITIDVHKAARLMEDADI